MKIKNIEGLTTEEINSELSKGAKFVIFQYCFSIIVMTFKRSSDIYFIKSGERASKHSFEYTLLSFVVGWWGIPWGPIYTISAIYSNLTGGKDVTKEIIQTLNSNE